ncbi:MAG: RNA methyltransferase [Zetaproteobacteria bacterium]|nr:RNA methyltransferase [Zetaproteobacteria bacterium]
MANYHFYAVVLPGLEELAVEELQTLAAQSITSGNGYVRFSGTQDTMYRVNLRSRCITRVMLSLQRCQVMSIDQLHHALSQIDWGRYLTQGCAVKFHVATTHSRLMHTGKLEDAMDQYIQSLSLPNSMEDGNNAIEQKIHLYLNNNRCDIRIDTSGERLDKRGYRLESGKAPVRETLAAAVLRWMQWVPSAEPLWVPMCGSGTFAIEAAQMATHTITHRDYAFLHWPTMNMKSWQRVLKKSPKRKSCAMLSIEASDSNIAAIQITKNNAERAGVVDSIQLEQCALKALQIGEITSPGVMIFNPPYNDRITDPDRIYFQIGEMIRNHFKEQRIAILMPSSNHHACKKALGLPIHRSTRMMHGGKYIEVIQVGKSLEL